MSSFIKTFYEISSDFFKLKRKKFCELDNIHLQKSMFFNLWYMTSWYLKLVMGSTLPYNLSVFLIFIRLMGHFISLFYSFTF